MKTTTICALLSLALTCAFPAYADTFGSEANTFDIEFVEIGNPGNAADTTGTPNPAGSVSYPYRIGKYEISEDMIDKANAEGGLGITKNTLGPDKPATLISWFEAAKFVNWLNTSKGSTPAYKFDSFGNFQLWQSGDAGYDSNNRYRNSLALYVLPSMDEWYKAAYYDPNSSVYYNFPTGSDSAPDGIDFSGDTSFDAVFSDGYSNLNPNDIFNVGVLSPYGTAGQGGNVWEWEETDYDLVNDSLDSGLVSTFRAFGYASYENLGIGFRVASIPEPSTLLLGMLGTLSLLFRRRC